jgi:metallo-beta-lactamase class B
MKIISTIVLLFASTLVLAQSDPEWRSWNQPVEPFRIAGNIYYVGANEITSFLITSPQGHILLDGGFAETAPQIRDNIRELGFKLSDVKYLLNSQAHFDHAAGLAQLKQWTGAKFVVSQGDAAQAAAGGKGDFAWGDKFQYTPIKGDRIVTEGEKVQVGTAVMTAHITSGHTKGCTTWTTQVNENGKTLDVVFVCSTTSPGYQLVKNSNYPGIVEDFRNTFMKLRTLPCDILLGAHGSIFDLNGKRKIMQTSKGTNPFVDPSEYKSYLDYSQAAFEAELRKQQLSKSQ